MCLIVQADLEGKAGPALDKVVELLTRVQQGETDRGFGAGVHLNPPSLGLA